MCAQITKQSTTVTVCKVFFDVKSQEHLRMNSASNRINLFFSLCNQKHAIARNISPVWLRHHPDADDFCWSLCGIFCMLIGHTAVENQLNITRLSVPDKVLLCPHRSPSTRGNVKRVSREVCFLFFWMNLVLSLQQIRTETSVGTFTADRGPCLTCCPRTSSHLGLPRAREPPPEERRCKRWRSGWWRASWGPLGMSLTQESSTER